MLKGCRKQIIVLRGTGSEIFDEAYFILKNSDEELKRSPSDNTAMLLEANKILEESRTGIRQRPKSYYALRYCLFFIFGTVFGALLLILPMILS